MSFFDLDACHYKTKKLEISESQMELLIPEYNLKKKHYFYHQMNLQRTSFFLLYYPERENPYYLGIWKSDTNNLSAIEDLLMQHLESLKETPNPSLSSPETPE